MTQKQELKAIHRACQRIELNKEEHSCFALSGYGNQKTTFDIDYINFIGWWPWVGGNANLNEYAKSDGTPEQRKTTRILALLLFHETRWS